MITQKEFMIYASNSCMIWDVTRSGDFIAKKPSYTHCAD
jgi:hypothetical protein